uniref:Uncharacterized protein n=1 Tax=Picea glauca TaxID=3330 RepID=A0A101LTS0_PICGL|nr:hypothetical protein ABT39_MTgene3577 [Picea glauca]QHR89029.1 hypothetical protein Q903MT_gene3048 [Picea sitchensis]
MACQNAHASSSEEGISRLLFREQGRAINPSRYGKFRNKSGRREMIWSPNFTYQYGKFP